MTLAVAVAVAVVALTFGSRSPPLPPPPVEAAFRPRPGRAVAAAGRVLKALGTSLFPEGGCQKFERSTVVKDRLK